jgi:hypothetical protein
LSAHKENTVDNDRSFKLHNPDVTGGFLGGFLGLLAIGWAGLAPGLIACLLGTLVGCYWRPLIVLTRDSGVSTLTTTRERANNARSWFYRTRLLWYLIVASTSMYPITVEYQSATILIMSATFSALCTLMLAAISFDSDRAFAAMTRWCFETMASFISAITWIFTVPRRVRAWARAKHYAVREHPEFVIPYAHATATILVWVIINALALEAVLLYGAPLLDNAVSRSIMASSLLMTTIGVVMLAILTFTADVQFQGGNKTEHHTNQLKFQEYVDRLQAEQISRLGAIRYTLAMSVRMFTLLFAGTLLAIWTVCVIMPLMLVSALGLGLPVAFTWRFVVALPRVNDHRHWLTLMVTMSTTVIAALLLRDVLTGYHLLITAFANGILCATLSVQARRLAKRSHELIPILAKFSQSFKNFADAFDSTMKPIGRHLDTLWLAGPLNAPMRALLARQHFSV